MGSSGTYSTEPVKRNAIDGREQYDCRRSDYRVIEAIAFRTPLGADDRF